MKTRLLAILLTDLSGFTEFSSRTDRRGLTAAVHQQQRIITPIIREFHGRLVKWIGDAALAVFGSAMDALLCGRRIQLAFVDRADRGQGVITPRIIHPVLDEMTGAIAEATRAQGGTSWGALQVGSFLTFAEMKPALRAVRAWTAACAQIDCARLVRGLPKVRSALHWGTLHVMKHTIMGRDIDVIRTLAALGAGDEVLLTADAVRVAEDEGIPRGWFRSIDPADLRDCGSHSRWVDKFQAPPVHAIDVADLARRDLT